MNPVAKKNILVEELPDETLVYDLDRHRAHCLNPTAAFLLTQANGERDLEDLSRLAEAEFGENTTAEVVQLGMERLQRARLVEWEGADTPETGISRKDAIRRLALVGLVLPAVMTIVTPFPAQAARSSRENSGFPACLLANFRCQQFRQPGLSVGVQSMAKGFQV